MFINVALIWFIVSKRNCIALHRWVIIDISEMRVAAGRRIAGTRSRRRFRSK